MTKTTRLTTVGALVALLAGTGAASAQDFFTGSWYAKGFGGFTFPQSETVNVKSGNDRTGLKADFNYDTGYTLGASIGYLYTPNFALEFEYAYRDADATGKLTSGGATVDRDNSGSTRSNSLMLNALYVFDGMGADAAVTPYVGGGIGGANVRTNMFADVTDSGGNWKADEVFAYQLIGGVGYEVAPNVTLFGEARWFATQSTDFDGPGDLNFDGSFETFDVLLGAAYNF